MRKRGRRGEQTAGALERARALRVRAAAKLQDAERETRSPECPFCGGRGANRALVFGSDGKGLFDQWRDLPCRPCAGSGRISAAQQEAFEQGRAQAAERKSRRVTQQEEADRLGMSVQELSKREWGIR